MIYNIFSCNHNKSIVTHIKNVKSSNTIIFYFKCFRNRNRQYGESDPSGHLRSYDRELALRLVTIAGFEVVKSEYAVASSDRLFFEMYKRNRKVRLKSKPAPLILFWTSFYAAENLIKRSDSKVN